MLPNKSMSTKTTKPVTSNHLLKRVIQVMVGVFVMIALTMLAITTLPRQTNASGSYGQQVAATVTPDGCTPYYYRNESGIWVLYSPCESGYTPPPSDERGAPMLVTEAEIDKCYDDDPKNNPASDACGKIGCSEPAHRDAIGCKCEITENIKTEECRVYTCQKSEYQNDSFCTGITPPTGITVTAPCSAGGFCPPVAEMGGNCISGNVIDVYHQPGGTGWEIVVTPKDGRPAMAQMTNVYGEYQFPGLTAGTYTVEIRYREGWQPYTPQSFEVTLSGAPTGCADTRFKMEALPCLIVKKVDESGNQGFDGLVGLPDWGITLKSGEYSETKRTNGLGIAEFRYLKPGTWTIEEEEKRGWTSATGVTPVITLISPKQPYTCDQIAIVNEQVHTSCIAVRKLDNFGNPLPNWTINLTRNDGTREPRSWKTDGNGYAFFMDLPLGEWTVSEEIMNGWRPVGNASTVVNLEDPSIVCSLVTFVNEKTTCVEGYKINHFEQGLSNWKIAATNATTGESMTTVTNADGYFRFDGLVLGTWTFTEEIQPGWVPVTAASLSLNLTNTNTCEQIRFKNRTDYACLDVYKYDNTGAPLPGWEMTIQPAFGGTAVVGQTDGTGWVRFNMLTPGVYNITETMQVGWDPSGPTTQQITVEATGTCGIVKFYNQQEPPYGSDVPAPDPESIDQTGDSSGSSDVLDPSCSANYTIRSGDTLYAIATNYGSTIAALQAANQINGSLIYPGQVLCVP